MKSFVGAHPGQASSVVAQEPPCVQLAVNTFLLCCPVAFLSLPSLHFMLFISELICSGAAPLYLLFESFMGSIFLYKLVQVLRIEVFLVPLSIVYFISWEV